MEPERADRVLELVAGTLELAPEERAAFLEARCGPDEALRAEVQSLIGREEHVGEFLRTPVFLQEGERLFDPEAGELKAGDTLGDCRIVRLLGEGGMGEVYLAQDTKLERPVAVKLLKRQLDDNTLERRFRHERRVLAALNHPHIARLYGSGVTPNGRAYLVMEYVEGERLDRYCQDRGLGVTARLALFRKVCAAVTHAHQNLVVHRDLKPANIRVTPEGEPKLLDFGIAKLLEPEGTGNLDFTVTRSGAMTPEYASPEQIKGEAITTASDVYSLGVVLYELLTGQRPYTLKSRRPDELARAICEEEPPRPSTVVSRTAPPTLAATVPAARPSATRLHRHLMGDLDNVVAKALRKETARRYGSVAMFSEDIRCHCEGLPVTARRDTLTYRADKFVRRNKVAVAAAALVLLALVTGLIVATWQAELARQERDRARVAQTKAEQAQKQAEQLNGFLQTLLSSANPESGPGRDIRVVQVLDQASSNVDQELAGEPALLAQAHLTIGQAYATLQVVEPALTHLRAALDIDRRIYGDENIVTARVKAALGATLTALTRRYTEAEPLLRQALAVERRQPPVAQSKLPLILTYEGRVLSQLDRIGEAKTMVAEYLTITRRTTGEQNASYASGLLQLGSLSLAQQDYAGAEPPTRQAVAILRRLGSQTPSFAGVLTSLAYVLMLEGKLDEPEGLLQEAREIYRRTVDEQGIPSALTIGCLGWLHFLRAEYSRAEDEFRTSQAIAKAAGVPADEQDYVGGKVCLALAMTRTGKATAAEGMLRESLGYGKANHLQGNAAPDYVTSALGECLLAQKRYPEAEECLLTGYDQLRKNRGEHDAKTVESAGLLHDLYAAWNKPQQAARYAAATSKP